jgi:hypothetical protein
MLTSMGRLPEIAPRLLAVPLDVVIDHMGLPRSEADLATPGLARMLDLLTSGRVWVKLSAPYYGHADCACLRLGHRSRAPAARGQSGAHAVRHQLAPPALRPGAPTEASWSTGSRPSPPARIYGFANGA